jgi:hypothetical protein
MVASINISVTEGKEYKVTAPAGITVKYNGETVTSTFIAVASVNQILLVSEFVQSGQIQVIEIVRGYYDAYDAQGGVWAYQPSLDKWTSQYSFRPEWMTLVGNRLVSFRDGRPYIHDNATRNTFYGQAYDSVVAFNHNEAGNVTKAYLTVSVEGSKPDIVHSRTEVPFVQSSDIRLDEFQVTEGVNYAGILRDRLSPNVSGSYEQKLLKGDRMRGEIGKFQVNYTLPTTEKNLKLFNIGFNISRGHNTIPQNGE